MAASRSAVPDRFTITPMPMPIDSAPLHAACATRPSAHVGCRTLRAALSATAMALMAACSAGRPGDVRAVQARPVAATDFIAAPSAAPTSSGAVPAGGGVPRHREARGEVAEDPTGVRLGAGGPEATAPETGGIATVEGTRGTAPAPSWTPSAQPGDRLLVESLVGQVNGRPIFADRFLGEMEDELRALARRSGRREFVEGAARLITDRLQIVVLNALFLADAEASLTPEEQVGLRGWLEQTREVVTARRGGGSVERAQREIQAEAGESLDAYLERIRDSELIRKLFRERIEPRVIVSWRDVERAYERRIGEFLPPAVVSLGRIRIPSAGREAEIRAITQRLHEAREPFLEVAESLGPGQGFWERFPAPDGALDAIAFQDEGLTRAVRSLSAVGDVTPPIAVGPFTWWVAILEIERPEGRSLYDARVQRLLTAELQRVRRFEEQDRYSDMLLRRGIYDPRGVMAQRLLEIAVRRYAPPA